MSVLRMISIKVPAGSLNTRVLYRRGDWCVTEPLPVDALDQAEGLTCVTHIPTTYAGTTKEHRAFSPETARAIVDRFAKELPRFKTPRGAKRHGTLAAMIIREECERGAAKA